MQEVRIAETADRPQLISRAVRQLPLAIQPMGGYLGAISIGLAIAAIVGVVACSVMILL